MRTAGARTTGRRCARSPGSGAPTLRHTFYAPNGTGKLVIRANDLKKLVVHINETADFSFDEATLRSYRESQNISLMMCLVNLVATTVHAQLVLFVSERYGASASAFDLGVQTCINAPGRVHTALVGILVSVAIGGSFGYSGQRVVVGDRAKAEVVRDRRVGRVREAERVRLVELVEDAARIQHRIVAPPHEPIGQTPASVALDLGRLGHRHGQHAEEQGRARCG